MLKNQVRRAVDRLIGPTIDRRLAAQTDEVRFALGSLRAREAQLGPPPACVRDTEFKAFSQWGEDGVIQYLTRRLSPPDTFVEIGVGNYTESNTRFLAMKDNWRGVIFDGGDSHVAFVRSTEIGWRHSINAVSAFVTAENVNDLIASSGVTGEIGLLSIDVDGVDYWLWETIDVVAPWIVVIEFNSTFGAEHAVTVPYDSQFYAGSAHPSGQYFGASLAALHRLGRSKGYRLVGVTSQGVNAFFVRDDVAVDLWDLTPADAYVRSRYRTVRDLQGRLTFTGDDHAALLASMADRPLLVMDEGEREGATRTVGDLYDC